MRVLLLDDLVKAGSALWFDKAQHAALMLWRSVPEWAQLIHAWARDQGLQDSVVTVDEMQASAAGGAARWLCGMRWQQAPRRRASTQPCSPSLGACSRGCKHLAAPLTLESPRPPAPCFRLPPQSGVYVAGTELEGLHREVLVRAVKLLEQQGKARLFKGAGGDDEGVKFAP